MKSASIPEDKSRHQDSLPAKSSQEPESNDANPERPETSSVDGNQVDIVIEPSVHGDGSGYEEVTMSDGDIPSQVEPVKQLFLERTTNYNVPQLERLYTRIMKGVFETKAKVKDQLKPSILMYLLKFAEDEANF